MLNASKPGQPTCHEGKHNTWRESNAPKIYVDWGIREILSKEETLQLEPEEAGFGEVGTVGREHSSWRKQHVQRPWVMKDGGMPRDLISPKGQRDWNLVSRQTATPAEIFKHVGQVVACLCSNSNPGCYVNSEWWDWEGGWWLCRCQERWSRLGEKRTVYRPVEEVTEQALVQ